jgi:DNA replication protein DnaC
MLLQPTLDKLRALNLPGMVQAFAEQQERADYGALAFSDRLGLLADRELSERENRRLERNLKAAKLRISGACIEDLDFHNSRGLDRSLLLSLAEAAWITGHQNVLIAGPTGAGKTYIACALAQAAIRRGHSALYLRAPRLLGELAVARGDGRFPRLLAAWSRIAVLLIDDFALQPLAADEAADLLEVIEDRSGLRSTIVTSQLPVARWHEALGDPTLADAILDRLVHNAHRIELRGESLRRGHSDARSEGAARERAAPPAAKAEPAPRAEKRGATKPQDGR